MPKKVTKTNSKTHKSELRLFGDPKEAFEPDAGTTIITSEGIFRSNFSNALEPWDFCTHHHGDENDAQAGPCPLHDAIGYCQICAQFIFTKDELKKHSGLPTHYIHMFQRKQT